ncbi:hypothetical protein HYPBUDRAFT_154107 [Hyphopichia burtonii NRRL Y-1933]|uniref:Uncharacterized protein n=1 Tax=Hyphopichia burtonii NRRL Y-1933 TaxID=984485 RepID=A0A1E4RDI6_9ASCO|nr:hypothetical protein HYPBUDRAFT_154107 [Hyphopichia burtonii NRRL Y-1933]ODV65312.1 hypothetical protein HYPBUDRAFT_154107 [Hyphopichia burtonii NRRL Y-1933]
MRMFILQCRERVDVLDCCTLHIHFVVSIDGHLQQIVYATSLIRAPQTITRLD